MFILKYIFSSIKVLLTEERFSYLIYLRLSKAFVFSNIKRTCGNVSSPLLFDDEFSEKTKIVNEKSQKENGCY